MEMWDLLDCFGNKTGQVVERENIPDNFAHLGTDIWIVNSNDEILIQKRSSTKRHSPNFWANTGGSVIAGETSKSAIIREVKEELGLTISENDLQFIKQIKAKHSGTPLVFIDTFLTKKDVDIQEISIRESELSEVKWATWEECEELFNLGQFLIFRWETVRDILKPKK